MVFDIGTTTIVGIIFNMENHNCIDIKTLTNSQISYGADVISRISFCKQDEQNVKILQQKILNCINKLIDELSIENNINKSDILRIVIVGNTTMLHIFKGINPKSLARYPFTPAFIKSDNIIASNLNLNVNKNAEIIILPNIAGHVGADITSDIIYTQIDSTNKTILLVDIGTNCEIVLHYNNNIFVCSTAAGPAFEGNGIKYGMRARNGAIEKVCSNNDELNLKVIGGGNEKAIGICGSGLIDLVAVLLNKNIIDNTGRILQVHELIKKDISPKLYNKVLQTNEGISFNITENILLTQNDIRQLQLAKSAIYSGIATLIKQYNLSFMDIDNLLIAGAFGNYIDKENAIRIGLLPNIKKDKINFIGNAASMGACMALLSNNICKKANKLVEKIQHIELSKNDYFQQEYIKQLNFMDLHKNLLV